MTNETNEVSSSKASTPETPVPEASVSAKRPVSEARLRANRENAKRSTGPRTAEGKHRSSLNATRHGILSQVIHLPKEELAEYDRFTAAYVADLAPVGTVETELAKACADLQFRLHRLAAAEHNLFAIGYSENGELWETGDAQANTALAFAETLRRSKDPLATITTYEQRLSRRLLQTLKQLREFQHQRQLLHEQQLQQMYAIATSHPDKAATLNPADLGFVCSVREWELFYRRQSLLQSVGITKTPPPSLARQRNTSTSVAA